MSNEPKQTYHPICNVGLSDLYSIHWNIKEFTCFCLFIRVKSISIIQVQALTEF